MRSSVSGGRSQSASSGSSAVLMAPAQRLGGVRGRPGQAGGARRGEPGGAARAGLLHTQLPEPVATGSTRMVAAHPRHDLASIELIQRVSGEQQHAHSMA